MLDGTSVLLVVITFLSFVIAYRAYKHHVPITLPSVAVRILYWHARWWMNIAVQSDYALKRYRSYKAAHPIHPANERPTKVTPINALSVKAVGK